MFKQDRKYLFAIGATMFSLITCCCTAFAEENQQYIIGFDNIIQFAPKIDIYDAQLMFKSMEIMTEHVSNGQEDWIFLATSEDPITTNAGYIFSNGELEIINIPPDGSYDMDEVLSKLIDTYGEANYINEERCEKLCQLWSDDELWNILLTDEYGVMFIAKGSEYVINSGLMESIKTIYDLNMTDYI